MGKSNSKVINEVDLKQLMSAYPMVRRETASNLTYCIEQQTNKQFIIKEIKVADDYEVQSLTEMINSKMELLHENIVCYMDYFIYKPHVCSNNDERVLILCEYPFKSMKEEIDERVVIKERFLQEELWSVMYSCIKGLVFLSQNQIDYDAVSAKNILVSKSGLIKLNDPWLNSSDASEAFVCRQDLINRYLAPEVTAIQIEDLVGEALERANIYSLGVVLLECVFLKSMDKLDTTAAQKNIIVSQYLNNIDKSLSVSFKRMLKKMLQQNPANRMLYTDILQYIQTEDGQDNLLSTETESVLEDRKTDLIKDMKEVLDKPNINQQDPEQGRTIFNINKLDIKAKPSMMNIQNKPTLTMNNGNLPYASNYSPIQQQQQNVQNTLQIPNQKLSQPTVPVIQSQGKPAMVGIAPGPANNAQQPAPVASTRVEPLHIQQPIRELTQRSSNSQAASLKQSPTKEVYRQYDDGTIYEGEEVNGLRHGQGRIIYPGGREYIGNWKEGYIEGEGKLFNNKKQILYDGHWKHNVRQGFGRMYNEQAKKLQQTFDHRDMNKVGNFWFLYEGNNQYKIGQFQNNKREGKGKLMLTNNQYFEGEFHDNMVDGKGIYNTIDRGLVNGVWQKGLLLF